LFHRNAPAFAAPEERECTTRSPERSENRRRDFDRALLHFVVAGVDTQAGQAPGGARYEPVRALMRAMLQDAILCLLGEAAGVPPRPGRGWRSRHQWINSPSHNWVFSFEASATCSA
jgi:hypothetical protein